jgi:hypothetical protein
MIRNEVFEFNAYEYYALILWIRSNSKKGWNYRLRKFMKE